MVTATRCPMCQRIRSSGVYRAFRLIGVLSYIDKPMPISSKEISLSYIDPQIQCWASPSSIVCQHDPLDPSLIVSIDIHVGRISDNGTPHSMSGVYNVDYNLEWVAVSFASCTFLSGFRELAQCPLPSPKYRKMVRKTSLRSILHHPHLNQQVKEQPIRSQPTS